jgi:hypothetical protein
VKLVWISMKKICFASCLCYSWSWLNSIFLFAQIRSHVMFLAPEFCLSPPALVFAWQSFPPRSEGLALVKSVEDFSFFGYFHPPPACFHLRSLG